MPNTPSTAVLGFRPHTYWTSAVALAGPLHEPRVLERRRVVFAAGDERSVYHRAETDPARGPELLAAVRSATEANAAREIGALLADLQRDGLSVGRAATAAATAKLPERLEDILRSHAMMHTAEGSFYRDVVAAACISVGLQVERVVERELAALVGDRLGESPAAVEARLKGMGAALGPPWSEDYKLATLAAWLHLDDSDEDDQG
jgi:hypothetical protein